MFYEKQDLLIVVIWAVMVGMNLSDIDRALDLSVIWFIFVVGVVYMREKR